MLELLPQTLGVLFGSVFGLLGPAKILTQLANELGISAVLLPGLGLFEFSLELLDSLAQLSPSWLATRNDYACRAGRSLILAALNDPDRSGLGRTSKCDAAVCNAAVCDAVTYVRD